MTAELNSVLCLLQQTEHHTLDFRDRTERERAWPAVWPRLSAKLMVLGDGEQKDWEIQTVLPRHRNGSHTLSVPLSL